MSARTAVEVEEERQRLAGVLTAEDPEWMVSCRPGTFGCHELLDRTAIVSGMVESYIVENPACIANREWFALAEQAAEALRQLYQQVGSQHL